MNNKKYLVMFVLVLLILFAGVLTIDPVYAAEAGGEYLQYQEPKPTASVSWFSTISYIFSLLLTFALVIGLAYFASRFLGKRLGGLSAVGSNKIVSTLSLGANRAVYIVEIAGKFLILGVTDQNISVLQEITDVEEIEKLKVEQLSVPKEQFEGVFQRQLASLQRLSQTFPTTFGAFTQNEQKQESEKR